MQDAEILKGYFYHYGIWYIYGMPNCTEVELCGRGRRLPTASVYLKKTYSLIRS